MVHIRRNPYSILCDNAVKQEKQAVSVAFKTRRQKSTLLQLKNNSTDMELDNFKKRVDKYTVEKFEKQFFCLASNVKDSNMAFDKAAYMLEKLPYFKAIAAEEHEFANELASKKDEKVEKNEKVEKVEEMAIMNLDIGKGGKIACLVPKSCM